MDSLIWIVVVALVGLLLVGLWLLRGRSRQAGRAAAKTAALGRAPAKRGAQAGPALGEDTVMAWPPTPTRLMNKDEREAFMLLVNALPHHLVMCHVPVSRFIKVPTRQSYAEWMRRIGNTCADLVVCDGSSRVIAAVEVRRAGDVADERRKRRQARLQRVLGAAGIRVLIWPGGNLPSLDQVRSSLADIAPPLPPVTDFNMLDTPSLERPTATANEDVGVDDDDTNSTWFDDMLTDIPVPADMAEPAGAPAKPRGTGFSITRPLPEGRDRAK